jgi:Flp pilus assembly protein TadG
MDALRRPSMIKRTNGQQKADRGQRGEALISVAIGASILITIAFFLLDIICMVLVNSSNDTLARNAARAAANQQDQASADAAANGVVQDFHTSGVIPDVQLVKFIYLPNQKVTVVTSMNVKVPAGVPGVPAYITFNAQDTEAIVGVPSTL